MLESIRGTDLIEFIEEIVVIRTINGPLIKKKDVIVDGM